jgi:DNA-binding MarR family transcriptional regulator
MHLAESGTLTMSALSERLNVTLSTVSIVVHQLASYGLVERQEDPADRRRTIVYIHPRQRKYVDAALAERTEPIRRALGRLEPEERAVLLKACRILAEEAEAGHAGPRTVDCPQQEIH